MYACDRLFISSSALSYDYKMKRLKTSPWPYYQNNKYEVQCGEYYKFVGIPDRTKVR